MDVCQAVELLRGESCPGCEGRKRAGLSVCGECWGMLPRRIQKDLYNLIGNGYEESIDEALKLIAERRKGMGR